MVPLSAASYNWKLSSSNVLSSLKSLDVVFSYLTFTLANWRSKLISGFAFIKSDTLIIPQQTGFSLLIVPEMAALSKPL